MANCVCMYVCVQPTGVGLKLQQLAVVETKEGVVLIEPRFHPNNVIAVRKNFSRTPNLRKISRTWILMHLTFNAIALIQFIQSKNDDDETVQNFCLA